MQTLAQTKGRGCRGNARPVEELERHQATSSSAHCNTNGQTVHEREAEKEADAIANEALYAGGASYSEANPGPNGETFSVRKGSRNPQSWDGVGEGTPWAKALKFLPRTNEARRGFFKRGSWDALVKRVAGWLTQMGTVKDPWGAAVKFDNPQKMGEFSDTLENRAAHLLGEQRDKRIERRTLDPDKRDWIGSTLETIRDAQVRVKARSGETLYFRSYKEGVHMVVVESGKVKDQYGLLTQYAPELTKGKFEGDVVERVRLPGLAPQGGAGSVSLPTQPQNQTAQTPTPGAQGKDAATGGQSQETHSLRNFDSASRAVPADASKQTIMPDGARLVGPTTFSIRAYHGTPHEVNHFSIRSGISASRLARATATLQKLRQQGKSSDFAKTCKAAMGRPQFRGEAAKEARS